MPLIVVSNPVCGRKAGHEFVEQHVLPLLASYGIHVDETVVTNRPGHAGQAVSEFVERHHNEERNISIILSSGDGTLHEIVNALLSTQTGNRRRNQGHITLSIALVPSGTANALYSTLFPEYEDTSSYKLKAVRAFITDSGTSSPLSVAETKLEFSESETKIVYSVVVTSTSLHASILHDSEALRYEVPDLERFKIAAKNNITRWYKSDVRLLPAGNGKISRYNTRTRDFEIITNEIGVESQKDFHLQGPFAYFTSTVNVDRLEPSFMISSLQSRIPAVTACMEVIVLRPLRHPSILGDTPKERDSYGEITTAVLTAAYQGGHADLTYKNELEGVSGEPKGIAEYFRCDGWKWTPYYEDDSAHLVCIDGSIFRIGKGGSASCELCKMQEVEFRVYH